MAFRVRGRRGRGSRRRAGAMFARLRGLYRSRCRSYRGSGSWRWSWSRSRRARRRGVQGNRVLLVIGRGRCRRRFRFGGFRRALVVRRLPGHRSETWQMRTQITGRNLVNDLYCIGGRWRLAVGQKSRQDEDRKEQKHSMADCGGEDRRRITPSRLLIVGAKDRRCHASIHPPPHLSTSAAGTTVTIPTFSMPADLIAAIVRITAPYGT